MDIENKNSKLLDAIKTLSNLNYEEVARSLDNSLAADDHCHCSSGAYCRPALQ